MTSTTTHKGSRSVEPTRRRQVVSVRLRAQHIEQLRLIAEQTDDTVSRLIARAVAHDLETRGAS